MGRDWFVTPSAAAPFGTSGLASVRTWDRRTQHHARDEHPANRDEHDLRRPEVSSAGSQAGAFGPPPLPVFGRVPGRAGLGVGGGTAGFGQCCRIRCGGRWGLRGGGSGSTPPGSRVGAARGEAGQHRGRHAGDMGVSKLLMQPLSDCPARVPSFRCSSGDSAPRANNARLRDQFHPRSCPRNTSAACCCAAAQPLPQLSSQVSRSSGRSGTQASANEGGQLTPSASVDPEHANQHAAHERGRAASRPV